MPAPDLERYEAWIERRVAGEPVAYILGCREFYGREFEVSPAVLIPRPETELLVESALDCLEPARPSRVLDLGTGSGCVALTIAAEAPQARVLATDASSESLLIARRNAQALGLTQVEFRLSDWFAALADERGFDLIVSNPPYVANGDSHLRTGDLRSEPMGALTPGPTGLEAIDRIIADAPHHLRTGGWLLLEHGYDQGEALRHRLHMRGFTGINTIRDFAGIERVSLGQWEGRGVTPPAE